MKDLQEILNRAKNIENTEHLRRGDLASFECSILSDIRKVTISYNHDDR